MFGYDFVIDEDLKVWLLEVNYQPNMKPLQKPNIKELMMRDLVKVVVDYADDKTAETGDWKLIT